MSKGFVTVFPGKRDHYEIAVALSEAGLLDAFITDLYNNDQTISKILRTTPFASKLKGRYNNGLDATKIKTRPSFFLAKLLLSRFFQESKAAVWEDIWFAKAAVHEARKRGSNLLLYEFQADYAFRQPLPLSCRKILFHFHPHPSWEHPILLADAEKYPQFRSQVLRDTRQNLPPRYANHTRDAWKHADRIIAASACSKNSIVAAGADPDLIDVAPYGYDKDDISLSEELENKKPLRPYFLFVGSGTQRKGLHHLCLAWQISQLKITHDLIIVARNIQSGMEDFIGIDDSIKRLSAIPQQELIWYYKNATAFVMPSISEGFGQVYLEALANGCKVIGTMNSMLGDLPPNNSVRLVEIGNIEALATELVHSADGEEDVDKSKMEIGGVVDSFTWEKFRKSIITSIEKK